MHFFKSLVVGASTLAAIVAAQTKLQFTSAPTGAQAGKSYTLKWEGGDDAQPVTILLREGPSTDLKTISTLTSSATGGSYTWNVPGDLPPAGDYALQITQGAAVNYWSVGAIAGGTASASASGSSSASASASASHSASSVVSSVSSSLSSVASSLSSKLSSATASKTSSVSAGVTSLSSSTRNGTSVTRATLSSTRTSSERSSASSGSSSPSSTEGSSSSSSSSSSAGAAAPSDSGNGGAGLKSNAALVLGAVAAMAYLG